MENVYKTATSKNRQIAIYWKVIHSVNVVVVVDALAIFLSHSTRLKCAKRRKVIFNEKINERNVS